MKRPRNSKPYVILVCFKIPDFVHAVSLIRRAVLTVRDTQPNDMLLPTEISISL